MQSFCFPESFSRRIVSVVFILLMTTGIGHAANYAVDPTFNSGNYFVDAFSGSFDQSYRAKKLIRLDNGDVVVAGIVPSLQGGNSGGLGLVRYNAAGQRVGWSNPGIAGFDGNQYIVYNPNFFVPHDIDDVKAITRYGDRIFVLVESLTYRLQSQPPFHSFFSGYAADVLIFGTDGAFQNSAEVGEGVGAESSRDFFAGGIGVYVNDIGTLNSPISMVFGGTSIEDGVARPVFRRFIVNADSSISDQTGQVYPNPGGLCPSNRGCEINGLALGGRGSGTKAPRIYLGGSVFNNNNWDFAAIQVNTSGVPQSSFNGSGINHEAFNIAGGSLNDHGRDIAVIPGGFFGSDQIFIAGDVAVNCGDGMGVVKFSANGSLDLAFGPGNLGKIYFGAHYSANSICLLPRTDNYTHAISAADGKLALVGQRNTGSFFVGSNEASVDSVLAVLDANLGDVESFDDYPYADMHGGPRSRHSGLWGVVSAGDAVFTAAGDVRYTNSAPASLQGAMQYATIRFAMPLDEIFANGFDPTN